MTFQIVTPKYIETRNGLLFDAVSRAMYAHDIEQHSSVSVVVDDKTILTLDDTIDDQIRGLLDDAGRDADVLVVLLCEDVINGTVSPYPYLRVLEILAERALLSSK